MHFMNGGFLGTGGIYVAFLWGGYLPVGTSS